MDVARLRGGGGSTDGAAPPAAEGAGVVGKKAASGLSHPDLDQGRRSLPLPPPGPGPRPGLPATTGAPAAQVTRQGEPQAHRPQGFNLLSSRAEGTGESKPEVL